MASDWIRVRTDLYRDPKIISIAWKLFEDGSPLSRDVLHNCQAQLCVTENVTRHVASHGCVTVWALARHRGKRVDTHLLLKNAQLEHLDLIADLPGFGEAMASVGWVKETEEGLVFPNFFEEYNTDLPKAEAKSSAERSREYRARKKAENDRHETSARVTKRHVEKRREEKSNKEIQKKDGATSSSVDSVCEFYLKTFAKRRTVGDKARRLIRDRLKEGFTVGDLQGAILGNSRSPFHRGDNPSGTKYHNADLIFRDADKVNQFIEAASAHAPRQDRKQKPPDYELWRARRVSDLREAGQELPEEQDLQAAYDRAFAVSG